MDRRGFMKSFWVMPFVAPAVIANELNKTETESLIKVSKKDGVVTLSLDGTDVMRLQNSKDDLSVITSKTTQNGNFTVVGYETEYVKAKKLVFGGLDSQNTLSITFPSKS